MTISNASADLDVVQEAQLRDQEREVALKEAEEESRLQEQVIKIEGNLTETREHRIKQLALKPHMCNYLELSIGGGGKASKRAGGKRS